MTLNSLPFFVLVIVGSTVLESAAATTTATCECDLAEVNLKIERLSAQVRSLRSELQGVRTECYIGASYMGALPDAAFRASSTFDETFPPEAARLNYRGQIDPVPIKMGWIPLPSNIDDSWLEVDLGRPEYVVGLITDGEPMYDGGCSKDGSCRVKTFKISFGLTRNRIKYITEDGEHKIFNGNVDHDFRQVTNRFFQSIRTRFIRIHPITYEIFPYLSVEFLGC